MQLAVNFSPQAADLFRAGAIPLDLWKCSDWPELVAGARSTGLSHYFHFDLHAGLGNVEETGGLDRVAAACAEADTTYVNLHVSVRRTDYPQIPVESCEPTHVEAVFCGTVEDIQAVADRFGSDHVIIKTYPTVDPSQLDSAWARTQCLSVDCARRLAAGCF